MSNDVIIVGGGFAGVTAALELRRKLPPESLTVVTLISASETFTFLPSLIWVAQGEREVSEITFSLREVLTAAGVHFVKARLTKIKRGTKQVELSDGQILSYQKLLITTGGEWAWDTLPGLAPYPYGYIASILSPHDAEQARGLWQSLLAKPGPIVIGATAEAGLFGAAYEFALHADLTLRRLGLREKVPILFLTPEPYLGHFGRGGIGNSRLLLEEIFVQQSIIPIANETILKIEPNAVIAKKSGRIESRLAMIVPAQRGITAVREEGSIANNEGFIVIDEHYRCEADADIFAAGAAALIKNKVVPTRVPCQTFIPGTVSAQMGRIAADNIAADLGYGRQTTSIPESIDALYVLDTGVQGLFFSLGASSWINLQINLPGPWSHWAKLTVEKNQLDKLKGGKSI